MPDRFQQLQQWVRQQVHTPEFRLVPASEDASFRRYFRLVLEDGSYIVMDAPPLQERCEPFIDIAHRLRAAGVNVPEILASDTESGFILLTDLGDTLYLQALNRDTADSLYFDAMAALIAIQQNTDSNGLPPFDSGRLLDEMHLFNDWLLGKHLGLDLSRRERQAIDKAFHLLIANANDQPRVFVHRDYHSRNLMLTDNNNPGILDFQDAVRGPLTYDLVSLLKDCYIKWPRERIDAWAGSFFRQLPSCPLSEREFMRSFNLMGVQRHLKASGIFARLFHRDGKAGFLGDIPRTLSYITDLAPEFADLQPLANLISARIMPQLGSASETPGKNSCVP